MSHPPWLACFFMAALTLDRMARLNPPFAPFLLLLKPALCPLRRRAPYCR
jgi:hypothetical protein